jgi:hypothetical protein
LPFTTFFVILFYAEGRAYVEGYLHYFGLNLSLFPVSADDVYWHAFTGWVKVMGNAPGMLLDRYPDFLLGVSPQIVLFLALPIVFWLGERYGWWSRLKGRIKQARPSTRGVSAYLAAGGIPALFLAAIPLILIGAIIIPALATITLVIPFITLGKTQAQEDCMTAASNYSIVNYVDESASKEFERKVSSARLLQCNSQFCVLIRDGVAFVIPGTAVRSIEGSGLGKRLSHAPAPDSEQLCAKKEG